MLSDSLNDTVIRICPPMIAPQPVPSFVSRRLKSKCVSMAHFFQFPDNADGTAAVVITYFMIDRDWEQETIRYALTRRAGCKLIL